MFKKFSVYEIPEDKLQEVLLSVANNLEVFAAYRFVSPSTSEKSRIGFSPTKIDNSYVSTVNGNLILSVTTQGKAINKNEVNDLTDQKVAQWLEENEAEETPNKVVKILREDSEMKVVASTYPKEAVHHSIIIRKDGKVLVEGKGKAAEDVLSLIRKALGSFPAFPINVEGDVNDMLKDWVKKGVDDLLTLGNKAVLVAEDGSEYKVKSNDMFHDKNTGTILADNNSVVTSVEVEYDGIITVTVTDELTFEAIKVNKELYADEETDAAAIIIQVNEFNKLVDNVLNRLEGE
ncbi:exonuclease recombination-associated [Vibrio phage 11895-B1]|uniref:exonuclease recombination-associated n=1 Tax=Vibrio phage 11895-B1 TaxID=754075 RepID=UPI0002C149F1|nr:exonuclease recombination-associated [Vibrio phage 11895-B1]AGH32260.1 hypothetical protein VPHG_00197 [Vibrio phage 11895-B1]